MIACVGVSIIIMAVICFGTTNTEHLYDNVISLQNKNRDNPIVTYADKDVKMGPSDFAVYNGRIYILDSVAGRVQVFSVDGVFIDSMYLEESDEIYETISVNEREITVSKVGAPSLVYDHTGVLIKQIDTDDMSMFNSIFR